jgi:hypothetical protein
MIKTLTLQCSGIRSTDRGVVVSHDDSLDIVIHGKNSSVNSLVLSLEDTIRLRDFLNDHIEKRT